MNQLLPIIRRKRRPMVLDTAAPLPAAPAEPETKRFPILPVVAAVLENVVVPVVNNLLAHQHPAAPVVALPEPVAPTGTTLPPGVPVIPPRRPHRKKVRG